MTSKTPSGPGSWRRLPKWKRGDETNLLLATGIHQSAAEPRKHPLNIKSFI